VNQTIGRSDDMRRHRNLDDLAGGIHYGHQGTHSPSSLVLAAGLKATIW
jgi:hypothetical protein